MEQDRFLGVIYLLEIEGAVVFIEKSIFPKPPPLFSPRRGAVTSGCGVGEVTTPFLIYLANFDAAI